MELGRRSFVHNGLGSLTIAGIEHRDEFLGLARTHLFEGHVEARIGRGHRDDVLNTRFESGRADRHVVTARGTEPIDGIEIEVVKHCLGRLLPGVIQINALSQGTALPGTIEGDDGEAKVGERKQEGVKLFHERIVAAVKYERRKLLAFRLKAETRHVTARVRYGDTLISGDALHGPRPVACEIVVELVTSISGGKIELRPMVVGCRVRPALFGFGTLGDFEPHGVPGLVVFCTSRDRAEFPQSRWRGSVQ
jgi:hypothetical protein